MLSLAHSAPRLVRWCVVSGGVMWGFFGGGGGVGGGGGGWGVGGGGGGGSGQE